MKSKVGLFVTSISAVFVFAGIVGFSLYGQEITPVYSAEIYDVEDIQPTGDHDIMDIDKFTKSLYKDLDAQELDESYQAYQEHLEELANIKPNESGKIMIFMFHNFITEYSGGDKDITITLDNFRLFLETLYENNYRPISMADYINNNIDLPAGMTPFILTFDDGWPSQFRLIEKDGELIADPDTAVGVLEEFQKDHPDFELRGMFYLNLGVSFTFKGDGTLQESIQYLLDRGFEVGNHSLTHPNFKKLNSKEQFFKELGRNRQILLETIGEYAFDSLALPYGNSNKNFQDAIVRGSYDGVSYEHTSIMLAGANPAHPVGHKDFDPYRIPRILAPGIVPVTMDGFWWIENIGSNDLYISDGNPDTISVPKEKLDLLDSSVLGSNKTIIAYE